MDQWIKWFVENYKNYCESLPDGRLSIPVIYSEDPEKAKKEHADKWLAKIKELMGRGGKRKYTHSSGYTETLAEAQFRALRLYNGPIFKSITEKKCNSQRLSYQIKEYMKRMIRKVKEILGLTN